MNINIISHGFQVRYEKRCFLVLFVSFGLVQPAYTIYKLVVVSTLQVAL